MQLKFRFVLHKLCNFKEMMPHLSVGKRYSFLAINVQLIVVVQESLSSDSFHLAKENAAVCMTC